MLHLTDEQLKEAAREIVMRETRFHYMQPAKRIQLVEIYEAILTKHGTHECDQGLSGIPCPVCGSGPDPPKVDPPETQLHDLNYDQPAADQSETAIEAAMANLSDDIARFNPRNGTDRLTLIRRHILPVVEQLK